MARGESEPLGRQRFPSIRLLRTNAADLRERLGALKTTTAENEDVMLARSVDSIFLSGRLHEVRRNILPYDRAKKILSKLHENYLSQRTALTAGGDLVALELNRRTLVAESLKNYTYYGITWVQEEEGMEATHPALFRGALRPEQTAKLFLAKNAPDNQVMDERARSGDPDALIRVWVERQGFDIHRHLKLLGYDIPFYLSLLKELASEKQHEARIRARRAKNKGDQDTGARTTKTESQDLAWTRQSFREIDNPTHEQVLWEHLSRYVGLENLKEVASIIPLIDGLLSTDPTKSTPEE
jgi:hypothetical protein